MHLSSWCLFLRGQFFPGLKGIGKGGYRWVVRPESESWLQHSLAPYDFLCLSLLSVKWGQQQYQGTENSAQHIGFNTVPEALEEW